MPGFLDHLRSAQTLLVNYVTDCVDYDFVDRQKLAENVCAAETDSNDAYAYDVTRFKLHRDHRSVRRAASLHGFYFSVSGDEPGRGQTQAGVASRLQ
jgi:hypothetical protein